MIPNTTLVPLNREINKTLRELKKKKKQERQAHKQHQASTSQPHTSPLAYNHTILDKHFIMAERQDAHREHERVAREHEHGHHREHERHDRREHEGEHHYDGGRQLC